MAGSDTRDGCVARLTHIPERKGCQLHPSHRDAHLSLGYPVTAVAKMVKDLAEVGAGEQRVRGITAQRLVEAQVCGGGSGLGHGCGRS